MRIFQKEIKLDPAARGFHLVTDRIERQIPELSGFGCGMAFLNLKHTSASLSINENADPDVRSDMETIFSMLVPQGRREYIHTLEGPDDMPAHAKSSIIGTSLAVPVTDGRFNLGTWQGIYLCEHRNRDGSRRIVVTIMGE